MNQFLSLLPNGHPIIMILIIIIAVVLIMTLVRALFKFALIAALIGFILVVFFGFSPSEVLNKGKELASDSSTYVHNTIKPMIDNGLKNAHVVKGPNGTIEMIGDDFEIGETPQGKYVFDIKSLKLSFTQDQLSQYFSKEEIQKLFQTVQEKTQSIK